METKLVYLVSMSTKNFVSQSPFSFVARSSAEWDNIIIPYDRNQQGGRIAHFGKSLLGQSGCGGRIDILINN